MNQSKGSFRPGDKVNVHQRNASVEIVPSPDGNIHMSCTGPEASHIRLRQKWGRLEILQKKEEHRLFSRRSPTQVLLQLPEDCRCALYINTVSGSIKLRNMTSLLTLEANSVSGNIEITAVHAEKVHPSTVSGNVRLQQIAADECLEYNAVSGDLSCTNVEAEKRLECSAVSGDMKLENTAGKTLHLHTVNGDITLRSCRGNIWELSSSPATCPAMYPAASTITPYKPPSVPGTTPRPLGGWQQVPVRGHGIR